MRERLRTTQRPLSHVVVVQLSDKVVTRVRARKNSADPSPMVDLVRALGASTMTGARGGGASR
jgi:heterodisulfide reductase subunit B